MVKAKKNRVATESYVWRIFSLFGNRLEKKIDKLDKKQEKRFDKAIEHLVDIAGKFKKFDEERIVMSGKIISHEDRIEKLEKYVTAS